MSRKPEARRKSACMNLRMTAKLKEQAVREANRDHMEPSEWVRLLIAQEIVYREDERKKGR